MVTHEITRAMNGGWKTLSHSTLVWVANLLLIGSFIAPITVALVVFVSTTLPSMWGFSIMVISSGSMSPVIGVGDAVVIRPGVSPSSIRVGDVITFKPFGMQGTTTHRVHAIKEVQGLTFFQTKGDANGATDPDLVDAMAVYGKLVWTLPKVGYLLYFASSNWGKVLVFGAPALLLAIWQVRNLFNKTRLSGDRGKKSDEVMSHAVATSR